jgi:hypothetical protein
MRSFILGLVISTILITSCSKSNHDTTKINVNTISHLGTLTADIDGVPAAFDSILECTYFTRPADGINEVIITGYKRNDTTRSNIQLMITGSDTILSGTYIDSVPGPNTKYGFQFTYDPPNLPIWFYGDQSGISRPEVQINFIQDSVQGTFGGRLINVTYTPNLPPVTVVHEFTNGKFHLKISHSVLGP